MSSDSQPLPDERPTRAPPPRVPPIARDVLPPAGVPGFGGGGGHRQSLLLIVLMLFIAGVASVALLAWAIPQRPATVVASCLAVAVAVYRRRNLLRSSQFDFFPGVIFLFAIGGGVVGELVSQVVFHVDPDAPTGVLWLMAGAIGIGGMCGVAVGSLCASAVAGLVGAWKLWPFR